MNEEELLASIKSDLGGDVISLGISDETIKGKMRESLRKVEAYSPKVVTESLPVIQEKVVLPAGTLVVHSVLSIKDINNSTRGNTNNDEFLFSARSHLINRTGGMDSADYLMRQNEIDTLMNFIEVTDWYYVKEQLTLFLNYYNRPTATVKYLKSYSSLSEVDNYEVVDVIYNYALALCKITEGGIRRKLSQAPGAIVMDGTELVQEGKEEKTQLEEFMRKQLSNITYGIRA